MPRSRARSADHVVGHLGPARGADHSVVERLEGPPSPAEHARIVRLGEHDRVATYADLQRIADLDPEPPPDLDRDDDPAEVVDPADDPSGLPGAYPRRLLHCIHSDPRHLLGWSPGPSITPQLRDLTTPYKKHAVLCHYANLLRQFGPSPGPRVHDGRRRCAGPSPPPAR